MVKRTGYILILLTLSGICILNSCKKEVIENDFVFTDNKNQSVINMLTGSWRVILIKVNKKRSHKIDSYVLFFNHCNHSEKEECAGTIYLTHSINKEFSYAVNDNGQSLTVISENDSSQMDTSVFKINDINSYNLILEYEDTTGVIEKVYRRTKN